MDKILTCKLYRRFDIFYCHSVVTLDTAIDVLHATDTRTMTLHGKWSVASDAARLTLCVRRYSENVP